MYINAYADRLLAENRQLKSKIAVYESDDALAQMVHACENRVRGGRVQGKKELRRLDEGRGSEQGA